MNRYSLTHVLGTGGLMLAVSRSAAAGMMAPLPTAGAPGPALTALTLPSDASMLLWGPLLLALVLLLAPLLWCIRADARKAAPSKPRTVTARRVPWPAPRLLWRPALAAAMAWVLAMFGVMPQGGARPAPTTKTVSGEADGRVLDRPEA